MVIPTEDPVEDGGGQRARTVAGQAVMGPARSSPRRSMAAWLLLRIGPPVPSPRRHFSKSLYSRRRVTRSRTGGAASRLWA
jgi:hypothetical protein